jgi:hypothetical protein
MAQEFTINSSTIENKINQLLPSQGGFGAGVDFSASTMVIPIVDLTESAEGSGLRQDLQTSLSFNSVTTFNVQGATSTIINTTGYWRIFGINTLKQVSSSASGIKHIINDGSSDKIILDFFIDNTPVADTAVQSYDYLVKLSAGHTFKITVPTVSFSAGCVRQIATINEDLVNP